MHLNLSKTVLFLCLVLGTAGCAAAPKDPSALKAFNEDNDPLEPMNRIFFEFNTAMEHYVMRPATKGYRFITTEGIRKAARSFTANVHEPLTAVHTVLQLKPKEFGTTVSRFVINTVFGFFGFFDVASDMGIQKESENLDSTLSYWGVPEGPYLVLPFLGPSTVRGTTAMVGDVFLDPLEYAILASDATDDAKAWFTGLRWGSGFFSGYEQIMDQMIIMERDSLDWYTTQKSIYRQNLRSKHSKEKKKEDAVPQTVPHGVPPSSEKGKGTAKQPEKKTGTKQQPAAAPPKPSYDFSFDDE